MKRNPNEIDEGEGYIGYREALELVAAEMRLLGDEELPLNLSAGRVAAVDVAAEVSYPSIDVSLKDGFAVKSVDVARAERDAPVRLDVVGASFAGVPYEGRIEDGDAVKVCSGAPIPDGADAVVSGEFCEEGSDGKVVVRADAGSGRNILRAGIEVAAGATIIRRGERISPGHLGLAAAAGISAVRVRCRPCVAIVSIGDEVVAPGGTLHAGQLYASNLVTMEAWLASFGIPCVSSIVPDEVPSIQRALKTHRPGVDAVLTSGGAWGSERDLVVRALDGLGWKQRFHYVRMGPGKGIAFGTLEGVPVFCLPGGPLSNQMAFLQIALPALLRMEGDTETPLRVVHARLTEDVKSRHRAWTEFRDAVISLDERGQYAVAPYRNRSRLAAIAEAGGLLCIPEGSEGLRCGDVVPVQLLLRNGPLVSPPSTGGDEGEGE
ncbi:MAG TPA: molybdopterin molybdotransferase MoeA [Syntrophales bacterium]|nr:molybdopterin molybdotransferase MoeA [Syntrophobacterales bacterium]HQL89948.1 molybdopterin molybdotransferase MoeA [Syntrophales bacterium]